MRRFALAFILLTTSLSASETSTEALRALEKAYVEAWRQNDRAAVMRTVSSDAVIIPSGRKPIRGAEAIEAFWFPSDGSKTTVTDYRTRIDDVRATDDMGWIFGTGELSFTWEKGDQRSEASQKSTFTMIGRRQPDGQWKIVHRMWTDTQRR